MERTITITLSMGEILYDVLNKTDLTGRSRYTGDNASAVAHMTASLDEGIEEQLLRTIGSAVGSLRNNISEYLSDGAESADNTLLDKDSDITVAMKMPSNFNTSMTSALASAMHNYIVNMSVADWFTITNKADADDYVKRATADLVEIEQASNKRSRPVRVAPTPQGNGTNG